MVEPLGVFVGGKDGLPWLRAAVTGSVESSPGVAEGGCRRSPCERH